MRILSFIFIFLLNILSADISNNEKINILTDYLVQQENKDLKEARNEAIATIHGIPKFDQLSYDNDTEMFFGRIKTSKTSLSQKVNFYMPKQRAYNFQKNLNQSKINIKYAFKNNETKLTEIELDYEGVKYPMSIKTDTSISLKIGAYFIGKQNTEIRAKQNGVGGTLDLQELFDLQEESSGLRIDLGYEFNQKHKLEFSYYRTKNSNTRTIEPIQFDGNRTIGGNISLIFNTYIYKFTYVYSAYRTNKFEFTTRIGIHYTKFETSLSAVVNTDGTPNHSQGFNINVPAPLPVFGLGFNYDITKSLALKYHVDYFFLSTTVKGTMVDTQIDLNYMLYDYLGFSMGLNSTKMDFSTKVNDTSFGLSHDTMGVIGSMIFRY